MQRNWRLFTSGCRLSTLLLQSTAKNSPERRQIWCNFAKQCATSPHVGGTGTITMNSSGIFVKATHKRTLGEWYIGSYGIVRWLFVPNLGILQPTNPTRGSGENNQWSEGCVSRSTPVVPVRAADMTINAPNVVVDMQLRPVNLPQTFPNQPEIELSQLHHIINSPPVTPVKVSTLSPLLQQYDPRLKQFLIDGFSFGFRVGFVGTSQ